jgi:hypothetical protein
MPNGRCRMDGGLSTGAPKGNEKALKHWRYTSEAIARRRSISLLIRSVGAERPGRSQCTRAAHLLSRIPAVRRHHNLGTLFWLP